MVYNFFVNKINNLVYMINFSKIKSRIFIGSNLKINNNFKYCLKAKTNHIKKNLKKLSINYYNKYFKIENNSNCKITNNTNGIFSLYSDKLENSCKQKKIKRYSETFCKKHGKKLFLENFFDLNVDYKKMILYEIEKQIKINKNLELDFCPKFDQQFVDHFNPKNFYIKDNSIVIFYDLNDFNPNKDGFIEFSIGKNIIFNN